MNETWVCSSRHGQWSVAFTEFWSAAGLQIEDASCVTVVLLWLEWPTYYTKGSADDYHNCRLKAPMTY